ncbi:50S ribosomal protein L32 [Jeotgalibaca ciconiae]|uniref:Large ribosomal subunit protein bL32 n=1 Tax=Jeotgalibaca ciconiae TaxID=2496265 RepID=A0A3Q9BJ67_9LACT|nr:50S ribosomal protein L32 [Jeotgalibaca ciconiae]AZP03608.1 50S ribosomal protein L32 [Jeotgalibaca ciconiae]
MAVPARKTSKAKKRLRRMHKKLSLPTISFNEETDDYQRSHHVSLKGYYKGRKVIE